MERRNFLKKAGVFAAGFYTSRIPSIAGPFMPGQVGGYQIPVDKKLDPQWVKSLYQRGNPTRYFKSKNELQFIGMPVGGINTGTLYLGGDGRLWLWDIFNDNREGIDPKEVNWDGVTTHAAKVRSRDGSAYIAPAKNIRPVDQGFAFQIKTESNSVIKKMEASDWDDIIFEATYPMARVTYVDEQLALEITAEIFSPFIALDEKNSGLPATIYSFKVNNKSSRNMEVKIAGWLENKTCMGSADKDLERINTTITKNGNEILLSSVKSRTSNPDLVKSSNYGTMAICSMAKGAVINTFVEPEVSQTLFKSGGKKQISADVDKKLTLRAGRDNGIFEIVGSEILISLTFSTKIHPRV